MNASFYIEVATSFIIGVMLILLSCFIFRLRAKGVYRLLLNAALGGVILLACNLFGIVALPLNPLNALLTGYLGVIGVVVVYLITMFF